MRVLSDPPVHLTYCLNIHAGESWADTHHAIATHVPGIRGRVCPSEPFGLGLRLSDRASRELAEPATLEAFRDMLDRETLYVFTINGFPYGPFHGRAVKEHVYAPDWRDEARVAYTHRLAEILEAILPEDVSGSISTVPGSYKPWLCPAGVPDPQAVRNIAENLARIAGGLADIHNRTGRLIRLALEPEPDCLLETTDEMVTFLTGPLLEYGLAVIGNRGEDILRRHIGVCMDTAHQAVEFEDPADAIETYQQAGIPIAKIQLSAALEVVGPVREPLGPFCEEVYLHQVHARDPQGDVRTWPDLPAALADPQACEPGHLWRVHFHVPLFWEGGEAMRSTGPLLWGRFAEYLRDGACGHLEIETYTFSVLPEFLRAEGVQQSVAREFAWVRRELLEI